MRKVWHGRLAREPCAVRNRGVSHPYHAQDAHATSLVSRLSLMYSGKPPISFLARWVMTDGKSAPQNIQDAFLNTIRREKTVVTIYLLSGAKLLGKIRSFDKFSVLLESGSQEQLIFKHAISTITVVRRSTGDLRAQQPEAPHAEALPQSEAPSRS